MAATRLAARRLEKVWGRRDLLPAFGNVAGTEEPVGEIWFDHPGGADADLLVKYLFTSEKLSIQVHPDGEAARAAGYAGGKDEAWIILEAEPGATIGLGLRKRASRQALRAAALDGSIEQLVDWRPVEAGDVLYSPAGTVHAIGPGLKLIEVQQNVDLTYRLYDYGRPRELHLEDGLAVARPIPYSPPAAPAALGDGRRILVEGPAFVLERWTKEISTKLRAVPGRPIWLIPVACGGSIDGEALVTGGVWMVEDAADLVLNDGADLLVAYPGREVADIMAS
jgi:mannose-6-phosphate isomerase